MGDYGSGLSRVLYFEAEASGSPDHAQNHFIGMELAAESIFTILNPKRNPAEIHLPGFSNRATRIRTLK